MVIHVVSLMVLMYPKVHLVVDGVDSQIMDSEDQHSEVEDLVEEDLEQHQVEDSVEHHLVLVILSKRLVNVVLVRHADIHMGMDNNNHNKEETALVVVGVLRLIVVVMLVKFVILGVILVRVNLVRPADILIRLMEPLIIVMVVEVVVVVPLLADLVAELEPEPELVFVITFNKPVVVNLVILVDSLTHSTRRMIHNSIREQSMMDNHIWNKTRTDSQHSHNTSLPRM